MTFFWTCEDRKTDKAMYADGFARVSWWQQKLQWIAVLLCSQGGMTNLRVSSTGGEDGAMCIWEVTFNPRHTFLLIPTSVSLSPNEKMGPNHMAPLDCSAVPLDVLMLEILLCFEQGREWSSRMRTHESSCSTNPVSSNTKLGNTLQYLNWLLHDITRECLWYQALAVQGGASNFTTWLLTLLHVSHIVLLLSLTFLHWAEKSAMWPVVPCGRWLEHSVHLEAVIKDDKPDAV